MSHRLSRFTPAASVRAQLVGAATMWAIGSGILLVRGVGYLSDRKWHALALAVGLVLADLKARFLLDRVARKAVIRIFTRGRACFFGFFSARSWALVGLMMGGGILLRRTVVHPGVIGAGIMGAVYIGIGAALAIADRIFWKAIFAPTSIIESTEESKTNTASTKEDPS